ncbi:MAG: hypothetical protein JO141_22005, partial [Bradyrhizobium sp.]|nr:hypothetical protein [Bradyrhizobium sp.]
MGEEGQKGLTTQHYLARNLIQEVNLNPVKCAVPAVKYHQAPEHNRLHSELIEAQDPRGCTQLDDLAQGIVGIVYYSATERR